MMWGVGKVTQATLKQLNVATFKDLREMPADLLKIKFGKNGHRMHRLSMGIDNREVITSHKIKSVGHELTFSLDILDKTRGKRELLALSNRVASRMRRHGVRGKTITLKVKYYDFVQITRSATSLNQTDDRSEIYSVVCRLLDKTLVGKKPVRLLGVSLSQLSHPGSGTQLHLFGPNDTSSKKKDLNRALDSVNHKFGDKSILPGTLIQDVVETESPLSPGKPPVAGKD
jgi:DNA polymerase-4